MPSPNSDRFSVVNAWSNEVSDKWCTEDIAGSRAGDPGGPLSINFVNGFLGADVYLKGFLVQKGHGCG